VLRTNGAGDAFIGKVEDRQLIPWTVVELVHQHKHCAMGYFRNVDLAASPKLRRLLTRNWNVS
jgi:hypothetical protein